MFFRLIFSALALILLDTAHAQDESEATSSSTANRAADSPSLKELERRIRALEAKNERAEVTPAPAIEEITKLQLELQLPEMLGPSFTGLGPGVSKVYFSRSPLSIGGYGEVYYSSEDNGPRTTNVSRLNSYIGFRFSKNIIFNSGLTFQNGGSIGNSGASRVEFTYIDFLFRDEGESGLRVGQVLIPFGIMNLRFEPNLFPTVQRMRSEVSIIPTTWHENGLLGFLKVGSVHIQGGVINGGDSSGYDSRNWIRGGRQNGSTARADDAAYVLRVEALDQGNTAGVSFYIGDSAQGNGMIGKAQVALGALHGEWTQGRLKAQALYTEGTLSDADRVSAERSQGIAKRVRGGYLLFSYDLLPKIGPFATGLMPGEPPPPGSRALPVFIGYERIDLQAEMPDGYPENAALRSSIYTIGINYKPHPQVVIKTDFAHETDDAGGSSRVLEAAIGFVF